MGGVTGSSAAINVVRSKERSPAVWRESWEGAFGVISSYAAMQQLTGSALKCTPCIPQSLITRFLRVVVFLFLQIPLGAEIFF